MTSVDVVRLRDKGKLTWDEIADRIGRDERTARRWYRKAKRTPLKQTLAVHRIYATCQLSPVYLPNFYLR